MSPPLYEMSPAYLRGVSQRIRKPNMHPAKSPRLRFVRKGSRQPLPAVSLPEPLQLQMKDKVRFVPARREASTDTTSGRPRSEPNKQGVNLLEPPRGRRVPRESDLGHEAGSSLLQLCLAVHQVSRAADCDVDRMSNRTSVSSPHFG